MPNLEALSEVCSLLQITGLFLILGWKWLPRFTGALISVCGFAAVVRVFLPLANHQSVLFVVAAICGVGVIAIGAVKAQTA
jgi:hypothetical protein